MNEGMFVQRRAGGLPYREAGSGEAIVAIVDGEALPTRAHELLAERRRVLIFASPVAAGIIGEAVAALGIDRFDLLGEGAGAAAALWLASTSPVEVGSVVLVAPDGPSDETFGGIERPVLVLCGTRDQSGAAERWRALLPDCHFMFVYDAGRAIGAERPEALAFIAIEFFERRDLFLVSRESGVAFP